MAGLIEFAERGGWHWTEPFNAVFAFMSGDPNDYCFRENGSLVIRKEERGVLSSPLIATPDVEVLDKFLSARYGRDVRRRLGYPDLALPSRRIRETGEYPEGFRVSGSGGNLKVEWEEGGVLFVAEHLDSFDAARLAVYHRFSADEIRKSYLNPTGAPLSAS